MTYSPDDLVPHVAHCPDCKALMTSEREADATQWDTCWQCRTLFVTPWGLSTPTTRMPLAEDQAWVDAQPRD